MFTFHFLFSKHSKSRVQCQPLMFTNIGSSWQALLGTPLISFITLITKGRCRQHLLITEESSGIMKTNASVHTDMIRELTVCSCTARPASTSPNRIYTSFQMRFVCTLWGSKPWTPFWCDHYGWETTRVLHLHGDRVIWVVRGDTLNNEFVWSLGN